MNDEELEILSCRIESIATEFESLRRSVAAILSHSIRRQHLPPGLTFDSQLWALLRELAGEDAVSAVSDEIDRTNKMLFDMERGRK